MRVQAIISQYHRPFLYGCVFYSLHWTKIKPEPIFNKDSWHLYAFMQIYELYHLISLLYHKKRNGMNEKLTELNASPSDTSSTRATSVRDILIYLTIFVHPL